MGTGMQWDAGWAAMAQVVRINGEPRTSESAGFQLRDHLELGASVSDVSANPRRMEVVYEADNGQHMRYKEHL